MGIPSIAFSLTSFKKADFSLASLIARKLASLVLENGLPPDTLLNVNIPPLSKEEIKGIQISRQGKGRYEEFFEKRIDPMNRTYYWLGGKRLFLDTDEDVDEVAIQNQYVTITPLQYDLTSYKMLDELKNWDLKL